MIYIVGIGPGHKDYIMPKAIDTMNNAEIIVGFNRAIDSVSFIKNKKIKIDTITEIIDVLNENRNKNIVIVASGDPLFYGITEYIKKNYSEDIIIIPGLSSFQYLMGRLNKSWHGAYLGSLHGREDEFITKVKENNVSIWLTDKKNSVETLAKSLNDVNLNPKMYIGENLSYEDEKITEGFAEEIKNKIFTGLSVLVVENDKFIDKEQEIHFIKDEEFIRGDCPMTKEEIRILSTAKLNLKRNSRVLDIGAGTGSVSIQVAKICTHGEVIGIEKNPEAINTIYRNIKEFKLNNLNIIEGEALESLPKVKGHFDSIFIGGSGGNLEEIITLYGEKLKENGKIVLNFITINNLYKAMNTLKELGYKVKCTEVVVSKTRGETYMLIGYNPIFIIEGERKDG